MTQSPPHRCLSQLTIERYLHEEFDAEKKLAIDRALAECAQCREKVEHTRADERAFGLRPVPDGIRRLWSLPTPATWWRPVAIGVPVAAAAALALMVILPSTDTPPGQYIPAFDPEARSTQTREMGIDREGHPPPETAIELQLGFYVWQDGKEIKGKAGQKLRAGDRIQFWYDAPADGHAVIVGIDGKGQVTRYFPAGPVSGGTVSRGYGHVVGSSVILDETAGIEKFYLCYDESAPDPQTVEQMAQRVERAARRIAQVPAPIGESPRLPLDCTQATIWIEKD